VYAETHGFTDRQEEDHDECDRPHKRARLSPHPWECAEEAMSGERWAQETFPLSHRPQEEADLAVAEQASTATAADAVMMAITAAADAGMDGVAEPEAEGEAAGEANAAAVVIGMIAALFQVDAAALAAATAAEAVRVQREAAAMGTRGGDWGWGLPRTEEEAAEDVRAFLSEIFAMLPSVWERSSGIWEAHRLGDRAPPAREQTGGEAGEGLGEGPMDRGVLEGSGSPTMSPSSQQVAGRTDRQQLEQGGGGRAAVLVEEAVPPYVISDEYAAAVEVQTQVDRDSTPDVKGERDQSPLRDICNSWRLAGQQVPTQLQRMRDAS